MEERCLPDQASIGVVLSTMNRPSVRSGPVPWASLVISQHVSLAPNKASFEYEALSLIAKYFIHL